MLWESPRRDLKDSKHLLEMFFRHEGFHDECEWRCELAESPKSVVFLPQVPTNEIRFFRDLFEFEQDLTRGNRFFFNSFQKMLLVVFDLKHVIAA